MECPIRASQCRNVVVFLTSHIRGTAHHADNHIWPETAEHWFHIQGVGALGQVALMVDPPAGFLLCVAVTRVRAVSPSIGTALIS